MAAREAGLDRITGSHPDFVPQLRALAIARSQQHGSVHIDELRVEAERRGLRPRHPNAWGAIFRGPGWVKIGARPSAIPSNHGHVSPVWRWHGP